MHSQYDGTFPALKHQHHLTCIRLCCLVRGACVYMKNLPKVVTWQ